MDIDIEIRYSNIRNLKVVKFYKYLMENIAGQTAKSRLCRLQSIQVVRQKPALYLAEVVNEHRFLPLVMALHTCSLPY